MNIVNDEPMGFGEFSKVIDDIDSPITRRVMQPRNRIVHSTRPMGILRNGRIIRTTKPNQGWMSA